ncbi:hypothetical protein JCM3766R1_005643 [Sporobolomyces carnicolor]
MSLVDRLANSLARHYHQLDRDVPLAVHETVAVREVGWLERHCRGALGLGSGNWQTQLEQSVRDMVQLDKPLAYVLGTQPFHPLEVDLVVRSPTLVPRPETEHWCLHLSDTILLESQRRRRRGKLRILDIGTGTGCIALGLTKSLSNAFDVETVAIDQSRDAVELARENAERCRLDDRVDVRQLDLFRDDFVSRALLNDDDDGARFDLVVSNPPYITRTEFETLDKSVRDWEDRKALVGERDAADSIEPDDGLIFYTRITSILDELVVPGGGGTPNVAFEVGKGQARRVEAMLRLRGYDAEVVSDPWGVERAVFGWRKRGT